jgi:hypothetical protein
MAITFGNGNQNGNNFQNLNKGSNFKQNNAAGMKKKMMRKPTGK